MITLCKYVYGIIIMFLSLIAVLVVSIYVIIKLAITEIYERMMSNGSDEGIE